MMDLLPDNAAFLNAAMDLDTIRATPEYSTAFQLEAWKQAEMAKFQKQLALERKNQKAELRTEYEDKVKTLQAEHAQKLADVSRLEERLKSELREVERKRQLLVSMERQLQHRSIEMQTEGKQREATCDERDKRAKDLVVQAKEAAVKLHEANLRLIEKQKRLQQENVDLQSRIAMIQKIESTYNDLRSEHERTLTEQQQNRDLIQQLQLRVKELKQRLHRQSRHTKSAANHSLPASIQPFLPNPSLLPNVAPTPADCAIAAASGGKHAAVLSSEAASGRQCCLNERAICNIHIGSSTPAMISTSGSNHGAMSSRDVARAEAMRLDQERERLLALGVYSDEDPIVKELAHQATLLRNRL